MSHRMHLPLADAFPFLRVNFFAIRISTSGSNLRKLIFQESAAGLDFKIEKWRPFKPWV